jgi:tetratricopeptide (TPR) repeat protein
MASVGEMSNFGLIRGIRQSRGDLALRSSSIDSTSIDKDGPKASARPDGIDCQPDNTTVQTGLARSLFEQKEYAEAGNFFRRVLPARPNDRQVYLYAGVTFFFMGSNASAIEELRRAAVLDPSNSVPPSFLCPILFGAHRYLKRFQNAEKPPEPIPATPRNQELLGHALVESRDKAEGERELQKAPRLEHKLDSRDQ